MPDTSRWLRSAAVDRRRLRQQRALTQLALATDVPSIEAALSQVVAALRPSRTEPPAAAGAHLALLSEALTQHPALCSLLRDALLRLLGEQQSRRLFTDSGVTTEEGYFSGLARRIGHRLLPEDLDPRDLRASLRRLFPRSDDHAWVAAAGDDAWRTLLELLRLALPEDRRLRQHMASQMLEALQVLSYRVAAIGLDPELVRTWPAIEQYGSPFVLQNVAMRGWLDEQRAAMAERRSACADDAEVQSHLDGCAAAIDQVQLRAATRGTSMRLAALLTRVRELLERQRVLLRLCSSDAETGGPIECLRLFQTVLRAENLRDALGEWSARSTELLARRITHIASDTGERYITRTRSEYRAMFRSAAGAGFIVAFMALNKIRMTLLPLSPLVQAVAYSLNYGLGFVVIYLAHFTIATKQPAMTASTLARALDRRTDDHDDRDDRRRLDALVELIVCTIRSQYVAVLGNVLMAYLTATLVAAVVRVWTDAPIIDAVAAHKLLHYNDPFTSLALLHAGIAGVCLFLAGLVAGYYANRAAYHRLAERLGQLPLLQGLLGRRRAERFGRYVADHYGSIAGNFLFGCMLGSMGTLGHVFGLPLDIRHVTFTTAHIAYALYALDYEVSLRVIGTAACGIVSIATVNLAVSFSLALIVAMRAQRVRFGQTRPLLGALLLRLMRTPGAFVRPPPDRHSGERERSATAKA